MSETRDLLVSLLTPEEREHFTKTGRVRVKGGIHDWMIWFGHLGHECTSPVCAREKLAPHEVSRCMGFSKEARRLCYPSVSLDDLDDLFAVSALLSLRAAEAWVEETAGK